MNNELYSSTIKKMNIRIIPFIMLLYLIAYIDRSNISVAALQMNADLALTAEMYGIAAGIFYISYIIFEVPSNVILTRVGAKLWIARINAAARLNGLSYSKLMHGLKVAGIEVNRKMLSDLAIHDEAAFAQFADQAKTALQK